VEKPRSWIREALLLQQWHTGGISWKGIGVTSPWTRLREGTIGFTQQRRIRKGFRGTGCETDSRISGDGGAWGHCGQVRRRRRPRDGFPREWVRERIHAPAATDSCISGAVSRETAAGFKGVKG